MHKFIPHTQNNQYEHLKIQSIESYKIHEIVQQKEEKEKELDFSNGISLIPCECSFRRLTIIYHYQIYHLY